MGNKAHIHNRIFALFCNAFCIHNYFYIYIKIKPKMAFFLDIKGVNLTLKQKKLKLTFVNETYIKEFSYTTSVQ